jgi:hypothetical protein
MSRGRKARRQRQLDFVAETAHILQAYPDVAPYEDGWVVDVDSSPIWSVAYYTYDICTLTIVVTRQHVTVSSTFPDASLRHWCERIDLHEGTGRLRELIETGLRIGRYVK